VPAVAGVRFYRKLNTLLIPEATNREPIGFTTAAYDLNAVAIEQGALLGAWIKGIKLNYFNTSK